MRHQRLISVIALAAVLFSLAGCKREEPEGQEDTASVDKKVEAPAIETEEELPDSPEPAPAPDEEEETPSAPVVLEDLTAQITDFIRAEQAKGTSVSVYAERLSDGGFASAGSQPQQSASLIKLFIAGCAYEHPEELSLQEAYEAETEELIRRMITASDNDSTNTLVTRLGGGDAAAGMSLVNAYCGTHHFTDTHMGRLMLDFNAADDNYTSVSDCGHILSAFYKNELPGSENILSYMKQQERTEKIPAGVPAGTETANKTGELSDVENDAAVIFADRGTYILCVILNQLPDPGAGRTMITELSSMVYNYMETQN